MTNIPVDLGKLSDQDLLARVRDAVAEERRATAKLIALLAEVDSRRLYLGEGCSSLFTYCTQLLHLSEHAAYNRIETARAARRFPAILELVASAALTLTAVRLLAPHLTEANHRHLLERARHKTKREVELLMATVNPQPDVPSMVRKLPGPATSMAQPAPPQATARLDVSAPIEAPLSDLPKPGRAEVKPVAPERYKIQFTVSRETYEKLRRAQDLLRHTVPNGDPAVIFERALAVLLERLDRSRTGKTDHPRASRGMHKDSRHIPAAVKRAVWERDSGRCAFHGAHGRCAETGFLEYHHVVPFASGGETSESNVELRCRAHNQHEADLWFGASQEPAVREERAMFGA